MRRAGPVLAALIAVGALAACSAADEPEGQTLTTVGTAPPPTPAPEPTDPYAIPATIDAFPVEQLQAVRNF